jgi:hypothetical protein
VQRERRDAATWNDNSRRVIVEVKAGLFLFLMWITFPHPIRDFRLAIEREVTQGRAVSSALDVEECDSGQDCTMGYVGYVFDVPSKGSFYGNTSFRGGLPREYENASAEHPVPIEVEYDATDPSVNRMVGDGDDNLIDYFV